MPCLFFEDFPEGIEIDLRTARELYFEVAAAVGETYDRQGRGAFG